jgi:ribonuclease P protein component
MLNRSAIIVDTKVSKRATMRNLLKRRVRSVLHSLSLPGGDLVIRLHKGAELLDFPTLREHLLACLSRLG